MFCKGILVKDAPFGVAMLAFEEGEKFHLPFRCKGDIEEGDTLCEACKERQAKTEAAPKTRSGIKGVRPQYLNGIVGETIPFWSRMAGSTWYLSKLKAGYSISEENMAKVKKAVERAYRGEAEPKPEPYPGTEQEKEGNTATKPVEPVKKRGKAKAVPKPATTLPALLAAAPQAPAPPASPAKRSAPTIAAKAKEISAPDAAGTPEPVAIYNPQKIPKEIESVERVKVRKQQIDGRSVYLAPETGDIYDMKCNFLGRWDASKDKILAVSTL